MTITIPVKNPAIRCSHCGAALTVIDEKHDCELNQFHLVIDRIAAMEKKIDRIDKAITESKSLIKQVSDAVGPLIDKVSNHPVLKGFLA